MKAAALFEQSPFTPLQLAAGDRQRLELLAQELLRQALNEYDSFQPPPHRDVPKGLWKAVKSHENCTVYAKSSKAVAAAAASGSAAPVPFDPYNMFTSSDGSAASSVEDDHHRAAAPLRTAPELLLSGTVAGTLDDVLYGVSACDSADVLLRTAYVDDSLLDGAVLLQLQMPTPKQPFRFLGVKWAVRDIPGPYRKLTPRDFVYLEATGTTTRRDGVRVGYVLRHPLELATCGSLVHHNVHRGRLSMSVLYTPLEHNTVDVFARGYVQLGGTKPPSASVTQNVTAAALLSAASVVVCAHNRKLAWLLRAQKRSGGANPAVPVVRSNMFACGMCSKKFGKLSSVGTCCVCCVQMCSRCRMARTLSFVDDSDDSVRTADLAHVSGVFCKNCIAHANQASAFDVASDEVRRGRYGAVAADSATVVQDTSATALRERVEQRIAATVEPVRIPQSRSFRQAPVCAAPAPVSFDSTRSTDLSRDSSASSYCSSEDCEPFEHEVSGDAIGADSGREFRDWTHASDDAVAAPMHHPYVSPMQPPMAATANQERQELWRKMTELRLQAESVYQLAKKNASMHMSQSSSSVTEVYDSDIEAID